MRFSIIGTGAVGGFYGGMLAQTGADVHFLLRSDYDQVKSNGLTIESDAFGTIHLDSVNAYRHAVDMPVSDVILVCLKSTENKALLPIVLPPLLHSDTIVILIQNGLGIEADLANDMPGLSIVGGIAQVTAYKSALGIIRHQDYGHLELGNYNLADFSRLEQVVAAFTKTPLAVSAVDNLDLLRWRKLVWNIPFNGLSVMLNATTQDLIGEPFARVLTKNLMLEVIRGANACGVALDETLADDLLTFTANMQPYYPSMKLDYQQGRPLEIKYIYEVPTQTAKAGGYYMAGVDVVAKQLSFLTRLSDTSRANDKG